MFIQYVSKQCNLLRIVADSPRCPVPGITIYEKRLSHKILTCFHLLLFIECYSILV